MVVPTTIENILKNGSLSASIAVLMLDRFCTFWEGAYTAPGNEKQIISRYHKPYIMEYFWLRTV